MSATFFSSLTLMKGPFFNERLIFVLMSRDYFFFLLSMMYFDEVFFGERVFRPLL